MKMTNSNKITNTKVGDDIHFYVNGSEDRGIVVKMNNEYVTVFKESTQEYDDIHINDTFFIKDILINKEWDKMEDDERFEALTKIHAPSPRFIMKSWNDLPKEIKELLTKNNAIETSHKEGKDDDMNNVDTRNFDDSANKGGFGGTERAGSTGEAGKDTGEKPVGGETKRLDAGQHKGGKKHRKERIGEEGADEHGQGKRDPAKEEEKDHIRVSDSIKLLSQQVSKDPEIAASDKKQEAGLQDTSAIDRQIVAHGKVQGRKEQGTKGKEVTAGVSALKAWQLWLAKREQQLLKEGHIQGTHSGKKVVLPDDKKNPDYFHGKFTDQANRQAERGGQTSSGQRTQARLSPKDEPISRESSKDPVMGDARKKSFFEQWLEEKSNTERSIHGNAGREPNSGVNTNTGFDAPKDYEGFSHSGVRPEQFKHERKKPKVTTKEQINIGSTAPSHGGQGTGDGGNPHNTRQQNKDVKGRAVSGRDRK